MKKVFYNVDNKSIITTQIYRLEQNGYTCKNNDWYKLMNSYSADTEFYLVYNTDTKTFAMDTDLATIEEIYPELQGAAFIELTVKQNEDYLTQHQDAYVDAYNENQLNALENQSPEQ